MRKSLFKRIILGAVAGVGLFSLASCGKSNKWEIKDDAKKITVAASPTPHAEILGVAKDILAKDGYTLKIKEYTDYVQPNLAVEDGDVDANYFQHTPYLEDFNKENNTHIVSVGGVHYEPFGIYAGKKSSISEKTGLKIAIPNDGTNEARALLLLQQEGFITLNEGIGLTATKLDIKETNGNTIVELEAAAVSGSRSDNDLVILNGNYALAANLKVSDALAVEAADSLAADTYVNILAVRDGNQDKAIVKALYKALTSAEVKTFIENTYEGSVVAKF